MTNQHFLKIHTKQILALTLQLKKPKKSKIKSTLSKNKIFLRGLSNAFFQRALNSNLKDLTSFAIQPLKKLSHKAPLNLTTVQI